MRGPLMLGLSSAVLVCALLLLWATTYEQRFGNADASKPSSELTKGVDPRTTALAPNKRLVAREGTRPQNSLVAPSPSAITGIVLNQNQEPVPDALVRVVAEVLSDLGPHMPSQDRASNTAGEAYTTSGGHFTVEVVEDRQYTLEVTHSAYAPCRIRDCRRGDFITVAIAAGAVVSGTVRQSQDPVMGAKVSMFWAATYSDEFLQLASQITDSEGRFGFRRVSPGLIQLTAATADSCASPSGVKGAAHGDLVTIDLELQAPSTLEILVRDARTRLPIGEAQVRVNATGVLTSGRSDANGICLAQGVGSFTTGTVVWAVANGYGRNEGTIQLDPSGSGYCLIELTPARVAKGVVVDQAGNRLQNVYVAAVSEQSSKYDWVSARTALGGAFCLAGLRSDVRHFIVVGGGGYGRHVFAFPPDEVLLQAIDLGVLTIWQAGTVHGTVADINGHGISGLRIAAWGGNEDRYSRFGNPYRPSEMFPLLDAVRRVTDAKGRFVLDGLSPGNYDILIRPRRGTNTISVPVVVQSGRSLVLEIPFSDNGSIQGRALDAGGIPLEGARLRCRRQPQEGSDDYEMHHAAAGIGGAFVFESLSWGLYELELIGMCEQEVERWRDVAVGSRNLTLVGRCDGSHYR